MSEVRLAFDASVSAGVTRYKVYWGRAAGVYNAAGSPKDFGLALTGGIDIDETTTWHISATAVDDSTGLESDFATELVAPLVLGCMTGRAN